jgi:uncharacterized membrane protein YuzA (DUF378 family)
MANCSVCRTTLTLGNRDLASLRQLICGECAKKKARQTKIPSRAQAKKDQMQKVREKQASISRRLRGESDDRRPSYKRPMASDADHSSTAFIFHANLATFCLWVAQAISILLCVASLTYLPYSLYHLYAANLIDSVTGGSFATLLVITVVGFCFFYAMAIVFSDARAQRADRRVASGGRSRIS